MDERTQHHGIAFVCDRDKAEENLRRHGVSFEEAIRAFFDPFLKVVEASREGERRDAVSKTSRFGSSLRAERPGRSGEGMKVEKLKKRLDRDRPMTTISIRFPEDVIDDLKRIAPLRGFSGYQPLLRAYVGQGLRRDLERLENDTVSSLVESLKRRGVEEETIREALSDAVNG